MKHTIRRIESTPTDYKLCGSCGNLNWYKNKKCFCCDSTFFNNDEDLIKEFISNEKKFYTEEYEDGINIEIEV